MEMTTAVTMDWEVAAAAEDDNETNADIMISRGGPCEDTRASGVGS